MSTCPPTGSPRWSSGSSTTPSGGGRSTSPPTATRSPSPPHCVAGTGRACIGTAAATTTPADACWRLSSASSPRPAARDGVAWSARDVELAVLAARVDGVRLNPGQEQLVERARDQWPRGWQFALAPAGSGKTTAMRVLATVWAERGQQVLGLAPSAAAAAALRDATGMPTRDAGQARPRPDPRPVLAAGCPHPPGDAGGDRRGRHGRHAHPRHGHRRGTRARRIGTSDR